VRTLSKQSNDELIKLIKAGIDIQDNYEKLYNRNHGFIYQVVSKRVHGIYELDDLMQQAFLALVKAVECFDITRPLEESNFLQILKFSIWNELRDLTNDMSSHMVEKIVKYNKVKNQLYSDLGRKPTDKEIALEMEIDLKQLDNIKAARRIRYKLSLDEPISDEEGAKTRLDLISDEIADEEKDIDNGLDQPELKRIIHEMLQRLPDKHKEVIEDRYLKNKTLREIGEKQNVSAEWIRNKEQQALRQIRKDYKFKREVIDYTSINEYKHIGVQAFHRNGISSVEDIVFKREKLRERQVRE
jgi:RNA polymerase sigma factor (sigma-70 family)